MILAETIFVSSKPVGVIRQDSNSGLIDFSPIDGKSPLPQRQWKDVDELKRAVAATYSQPVKEEGPLNDQ